MILLSRKWDKSCFLDSVIHVTGILLKQFPISSLQHRLKIDQTLNLLSLHVTSAFFQAMYYSVVFSLLAVKVKVPGPENDRELALDPRFKDLKIYIENHSGGPWAIEQSAYKQQLKDRLVLIPDKSVNSEVFENIASGSHAAIMV